MIKYGSYVIPRLITTTAMVIKWYIKNHCCKLHPQSPVHPLILSGDVNRVWLARLMSNMIFAGNVCVGSHRRDN